MKPVIGVDFDDVLMDFNRQFVRFHNEHHGTSVNYEDIKQFFLETTYSCSVKEMAERISLFYRSDWHDSAPPIPGSIEAVRHLQHRFELHIITGRPASMRGRTKRWLEKHFPNQIRELHFTNHFSESPEQRAVSKAVVCAQVEAKVFIEDAAHHAIEVAQQGFPVILLDRPWNRTELPGGVTRAYSWDEVLQHLNRAV